MDEIRKDKKRIDFYIDLSNGQEEIAVKFPSKCLQKLKKNSFFYQDDYITSSFIKNRDINDYSLFPEYGCKCSQYNDENEIICDKDTCECIINHQQNYECNNFCKCGYSCFNRKIQKGLSKKLLVNYVDKQKGFGVFSLDFIKKDEFICEYIGEIINKNFALEKIKLNSYKNKKNYIMQIREIYHDSVINTYIDAENKGNVSRFLNHSCEPNMYFDFLRVEHFIPRVAFYAKRDIVIGEELTFSYIGDNFDEFDKDKDGEFSKNKPNSEKVCLCNAKNCMKFLPSF